MVGDPVVSRPHYQRPRSVRATPTDEPDRPAGDVRLAERHLCPLAAHGRRLLRPDRHWGACQPDFQRRGRYQPGFHGRLDSGYRKRGVGGVHHRLPAVDQLVLGAACPGDGAGHAARRHLHHQAATTGAALDSVEPGNHQRLHPGGGFRHFNDSTVQRWCEDSRRFRCRQSAILPSQPAFGHPLLHLLAHDELAWCRNRRPAALVWWRPGHPSLAHAGDAGALHPVRGTAHHPGAGSGGQARDLSDGCGFGRADLFAARSAGCRRRWGNDVTDPARGSQFRPRLVRVPGRGLGVERRFLRSRPR